MADIDKNELSIDDLASVTGGITPITVDVFGARPNSLDKGKKVFVDDKIDRPIKALSGLERVDELEPAKPGHGMLP